VDAVVHAAQRDLASFALTEEDSMHFHRQTSAASAFRVVPLALALLLGACASTAPDAPGVLPPDTLACSLPSNCVSSLSGAPPLRFDGTSAQALERLRTSLASFPEARIVRAEGLALEAVFTTPAGFQDSVDFQINPAQQRIDYRSRSTLGIYDFGKNRSRMQLFAERFGAALER
jgi:uncharacterized protein (DUF1499 family)